MLTAPDAETTQLMFGRCKPEDQTNPQPIFSDASDAATHIESIRKAIEFFSKNFKLFTINLFQEISPNLYFVILA